MAKNGKNGDKKVERLCPFCGTKMGDDGTTTCTGCGKEVVLTEAPDAGAGKGVVDPSLTAALDARLAKDEAEAKKKLEAEKKAKDEAEAKKKLEAEKKRLEALAKAQKAADKAQREAEANKRLAESDSAEQAFNAGTPDAGSAADVAAADQAAIDVTAAEAARETTESRPPRSAKSRKFFGLDGGNAATTTEPTTDQAPTQVEMVAARAMPVWGWAALGLVAVGCYLLVAKVG